jgi:uncharacterized protein (TIGR00369 family)
MEMEVSFSEKCFVCGKNNPDGLHLAIHRDNEEKAAWAEIAVPEKFCGWEGIIHGGIISTLLDEIMAYSAFTHDEKGVTGEISVRFRKPMPSNKTVRVEGCVESERGRILCTTGKITLGDVLIAEATAKMVRLD